jgi:hypothetical protein
MRPLASNGRARLARQVYAALLYQYPADFRRSYAQELTRLFADMHRAACAEGRRAYCFSLLQPCSITPYLSCRC